MAPPQTHIFSGCPLMESPGEMRGKVPAEAFGSPSHHGIIVGGRSPLTAALEGVQKGPEALDPTPAWARLPVGEAGGPHLIE